MIDFEAIHAALFTLAQSIPGIKTFSRTWKVWDQVSPGEQPALFQTEKDFEAQPVMYVPPKWTLHAEWIVYVNGNASDQLPSTQLNTILNAIASVIPPTNNASQVQTLGGLVQRCWISGRIETDEGVLGQQRVAIVPIEILVA